MNDGTPSPHQTRRGQSATATAILDELEREPGSTTKELAAATGREYRAVHGYLMPLCALGLVACTKVGDVNSWRLIRRPLPTLSDHVSAAYRDGVVFGSADVAGRYALSLSKACRVLRSMEDRGQIERVPGEGRRKYRVPPAADVPDTEPEAHAHG
jgi:DNA-binding IclR family transcriptional regulator